MNEASSGGTGGRPSLKTVIAVISFALMGATAYGLWYLFTAPGDVGDDVDDRETLQAGPLPTSPSVTADRVEEESHELSIPGSLTEPRQAIEVPGPEAMRGFHEALEQLEEGERKLVRVLHYGDSILTTDQLSGEVRRILQGRFGDGGHGFVLLGKPWRWYGHVDVDHGARGKWRGRPITSDPVRDGMYGLGGVAMEPQRASHGRAWAGPSLDEESQVGKRVSSFDVSYMVQPRGGSFQIKLDGQVQETVSTAADETAAVHKVIEAPTPRSRLEVQYNNDGPVRLFGVVLETDGPGIVYDSLAINGARASVLGRYDESHWASELERRDPALVVVMFGANEGANRFLVLKEYRVHLRELLRNIRKAVPRSSILVVGPLDQARRNGDHTFSSWKMPIKLSQAQREVAMSEGCAFFDTWTAMGGEGSMGKWFRHGLGGGDLIHPTEHGARKIGGWLAEALLYDYYKARSDSSDGADGSDGSDAGADSGR